MSVPIDLIINFSPLYEPVKDVSFSMQLDQVAKFFAPGTLFLIVLFFPRLYLVLDRSVLGFWLSDQLFLDTDLHN